MSRKIEGSKLKKVGPDDPTFTFASSWIFGPREIGVAVEFAGCLKRFVEKELKHDQLYSKFVEVRVTMRVKAPYHVAEAIKANAERMRKALADAMRVAGGDL